MGSLLLALPPGGAARSHSVHGSRSLHAARGNARAVPTRLRFGADGPGFPRERARPEGGAIRGDRSCVQLVRELPTRRDGAVLARNQLDSALLGRESVVDTLGLLGR